MREFRYVDDDAAASVSRGPGVRHAVGVGARGPPREYGVAALVFGGEDLVRDDGDALVQVRWGRGVSRVVAEGGKFVAQGHAVEAEDGGGEGEEGEDDG